MDTMRARYSLAITYSSTPVGFSVAPTAEPQSPFFSPTFLNPQKSQYSAVFPTSGPVLLYWGKQPHFTSRHRSAAILRPVFNKTFDATVVCSIAMSYLVRTKYIAAPSLVSILSMRSVPLIRVQKTSFPTLATALLTSN